MREAVRGGWARVCVGAEVEVEAEVEAEAAEK